VPRVFLADALVKEFAVRLPNFLPEFPFTLIAQEAASYGRGGMRIWSTGWSNCFRVWYE